MDDDLSRLLAEFTGRGYVIAPAGYGKTHLIALAVKASSRRKLILTHTYAGVSAIKKKLQLLRVPSTRYQVDTIASWALRFCLYFPQTSKWSTDHPTGKEWTKLYATCAALLDRSFVQHVIRCSYGGVYVDEYQDCSMLQHALVHSLSRHLPCCLLGDPMQEIFDFADQPVDWDRDVCPHYQLLGELKTPWRWQLAGAADLGDWLGRARMQLRDEGRVSLATPLPKGVNQCAVDLNDFKNPKRLKVFYEFLGHDETVIAIHAGDQKSKNKTHKLALALGGKFSSIEEVEGKVLFTFVKKMGAATTSDEKLRLVIDFAKRCCKSVDGILTAATKRGEHGKLTRATKHPEILEMANRFRVEASSENMASLLTLIRDHPVTSTYRRDLLNRLMNVLRMHCENSLWSLTEAARQYQREFRYSGRPIRHSKLIGTTLLVKGLEYQHAIILEAESTSSKELYVALTRGARTITIVTTAGVIPS